MKNSLGKLITISNELLDNKKSNRIFDIITESVKYEGDGIYLIKIKGLNEYVTDEYVLNECDDFWYSILNLTNNFYKNNSHKNYYSQLTTGNSIAFTIFDMILFVTPDCEFTVDFNKHEVIAAKGLIELTNSITIKPNDTTTTRLTIGMDYEGNIGDEEIESISGISCIKIAVLDKKNNSLYKISNGFETYLNDFKDLFVDDSTAFRYLGPETDLEAEINMGLFSKEILSPSEYYISQTKNLQTLVLTGDVELKLFSYNTNDILETNVEEETDEYYKLKLPITININNNDIIIQDEHLLEYNNVDLNLINQLRCNRVYFVDKIYKKNIIGNEVIIEILVKYNRDFSEDYGFYY